MRPEGINPLDLNNFPEDYIIRDHGKQVSEEYSSSSSAGIFRKKKSGGSKQDGKADEAAGEKVYECRFCSLKFCKSQALGGHMNRHRQERETETLNKARELVFTNDVVPTHLCYSSSGQSIPHGGFHPHPHQAVANNLCPDSTAGLPFRSMYPSRMYSTSPVIPAAAAAPYMYPSPTHHMPSPPAVNDYFVIGHAVSSSSYGSGRSDEGNHSYTCVGAPVGQGGLAPSSRGGVRDESRHDQEEGMNWGRR